MYTKQCDCLKNCLCIAIRFGQFGQTMGTGHYYFDEIVEHVYLLKNRMVLISKIVIFLGTST
jgi:hypothetical protein